MPFQSVGKKVLGIDDTNMVEMIALLNQLGFSGSRGGTGFLAAASRSIPGIFGSGLLKGKSAEALKAMGMSDAKGNATFFKDGKFDTHLWMEKLSGYVAREFATHPEAIARQDIQKNLSHALGVNGARIAALLGDDSALKQLLSIHEKFGKLPSVDATQGAFADQSVYQGYENAKTNINSLLTELGYPLLPEVQEKLKGFNGTLNNLIATVHDNPKSVIELTHAFAGLAGALAFAGSVNALKFAFGGLGGALAALAVTAYAIAHPDETKSALNALGKSQDDDAWYVKYNPFNISSRIGQAIGRQAVEDRREFGGFAPPPKSSNPIRQPIVMQMDGRTIARTVADIYVDAARQPNSGGTFDMRQGAPSPAWGF